MVYLNHPYYRIAAWIGIALLAGGLVAVVVQGRWLGVGMLAAFLSASVAFIFTRERLPNLFNLIFVLAAVVNAAGWVWDLYSRIGPYDEMAHAFTTFALTLALGFLVYYSVKAHFATHGLLFVLAIANLGIAIGAIWEVFEWVVNISHSLNDAMIDLIMDSTGAVVAGIFSAWAVRRPSGTTSANREPPEDA